MSADARHERNYDAEGRPLSRRRTLKGAMDRWVAEHDLTETVEGMALSVLAGKIDKATPSAAAALMSEMRRVTDQLPDLLPRSEPDPAVKLTMNLVVELIEAGTDGLTSAEVALYDLVLRPGSPWRS